MTSDGIADKDWCLLEELATELANATGADDDILSESLTLRILSYLDDLERTYGPKPSIIATRADYIESEAERVALLLKAYCLAEESGDRYNLRLIAQGLQEFYKEKDDAENKQLWRSRSQSK